MYCVPVSVFESFYEFQMISLTELKFILEYPIYDTTVDITESI